MNLSCFRLLYPQNVNNLIALHSNPKRSGFDRVHGEIIAFLRITAMYFAYQAGFEWPAASRNKKNADAGTIFSLATAGSSRIMCIVHSDNVEQ